MLVHIRSRPPTAYLLEIVLYSGIMATLLACIESVRNFICFERDIQCFRLARPGCRVLATLGGGLRELQDCTESSPPTPMSIRTKLVHGRR